MAWTLVEVFGSWGQDDAHRRLAAWRAVLPNRLTSSVDSGILNPGEYAHGELSQLSDKQLSVGVPAVDDPTLEQPAGSAQVEFEVLFEDGTTELYVVAAPYADRAVADGGTGAGVNLRDLDPVVSAPGPVLYPRSFVGSGSPEGVVAAAAPSYYTDEHGTGGVWLWVKTSGTGDTGWVPLPIRLDDIVGATAVGRQLAAAADAAAVRAIAAAASATDVTALATTVAGKVARAGDTMTGDLAIDNSAGYSTVRWRNAGSDVFAIDSRFGHARIYDKVRNAYHILLNAADGVMNLSTLPGLKVPAPSNTQHPPRLARTPVAVTGDLGLPGYAGSDTGMREIGGILPNGLTGYGPCTLRRHGAMVELVLELNWTSPPTAPGGTIIYTLPAGFRPRTPVYGPTPTYGSATTFVVVGTSVSMYPPYPAAQAAERFHLTWMADPGGGWPASLPGTQVTAPAAWS